MHNCCSSKAKGARTRSTNYAERAQNPCNLVKRMCTNCRQIQMAKPAKPARSMASGQPKKKMASVSCKTRNPHEKIAPCWYSTRICERIWLVTIFSTIFQLAGAFASRFELFSMKKSNISHSQQHNRYLFRQPFSIIFVLLQQCFASDAAKRPQSWESERFCATTTLPLIFRNLWCGDAACPNYLRKQRICCLLRTRVIPRKICVKRRKSYLYAFFL